MQFAMSHNKLACRDVIQLVPTMHGIGWSKVQVIQSSGLLGIVYRWLIRSLNITKDWNLTMFAIIHLALL